MPRHQKKRTSYATYLLAILGIFITISMILYPDTAFAAAKSGLDIWWDTVFPALLPFFIGSELLMGIGVVSLMGSLLEPLMRPLFNVPGEGSFVMAMGLASGYPIGAILTAKLRRQKICNKHEAERLISTANTADPLFMFGAVAVGFFHNVRIGAILALAHYLSAITVGLTMRFYHRHAPRTVKQSYVKYPYPVRALRALKQARQKDGRPIGQLLGDSVKQSVNSLLMIGGFIIFFSVINAIACASGILTPIIDVLGHLCTRFGLSPDLAPAAMSGFFEISMGCKLSSSIQAPLLHCVVLAGSIIAWSGLSVLGQVATIIHDTDIDLRPYILARIWQAILAGFFTWLVFTRMTLTTSAGFERLLAWPIPQTFLSKMLLSTQWWLLACLIPLGLGILLLPFAKLLTKKR